VPELHIVAALVRRGDELLMVRQAGPGEEPVWSIPGGRVEAAELVTEALVREVLEETGLRVSDPGRVAFVAQVDEQSDNWFATVWTWEVAAWDGDLAPNDPDGYVSDAAFVPLDEAVERLSGIAWHPLTVRYLRGELPRSSLWLRRVHADGTDETSGPY
jgi:ADP-ribose pyrophosphatase YjhB (NUDIX family)